jgi:glycosyltransferase involved in cell wall biosynthesis
MKPLLLNTFDITGGAGRAAYRLHQGLQQMGIPSHMLVQTKSSDNPTVTTPQGAIAQGVAKFGHGLDALPRRFSRSPKKAEFSTQWVPNPVATAVAHLNPDLVNLHWINDSFLQIEAIAQLKQPIVWSLHDMWAFTGGCHYDQSCGRYTTACGQCPQLGSASTADLSHWIWQRKAKSWRQANLTVVALSAWLADCARASALMRNVRIEVIPNGIDTQQFRPVPRHLARDLLGLPQDKHLILFGAVNATSATRKGFQFLQPALQRLAQSGWAATTELVVFGASQPQKPADMGFPTHYLGRFGDDLSLALIYGAADVFVAPSIQENLSNAVMEALACGVPCVAFNVGGMPDMIEHGHNGYLVQPFEIDDLAKGVAWVLGDGDRHQILKQRSRQKVEQEFAQAVQAQRYAALFEDILQRGDAVSGYSVGQKT